MIGPGIRRRNPLNGRTAPAVLLLLMVGAGGLSGAPTNADGLARARRLNEQGYWFEAVGALTEHVRNQPDDLDARYELARALFRLGNYGEAVETAMALPENDEVYGPQRQYLLMRLRMRAARDIDWDDPRDLLRFARLCGRMGSYERAGRMYRRLLADRDDPGLRHEYALLLMWAGEHDRATREWVRVIENSPEDADARHQLARAHIALGQLKEADAALAGALRLRKDAPSIRLDLARLRIWQGQTAEAESILDTLTAQRHEPVETGLLRAELLLRMSRVEEAHMLLQEVAAAAPDEPRVRRMLQDLSASRRVDIARLRRRLEAHPDRETDRIGLIDLFLEVQRPGAALREMITLAGQRPNDPLLQERIRRLRNQQHRAVREWTRQVARSLTPDAGTTVDALIEWIARHPDDRQAERRLAEVQRWTPPPSGMVLQP